VLDGHVSFVPSGADAQILVLPAGSAAGGKLVAVELSASGVTLVPQPTMVGAPEARFVFANTPVLADLAGTVASPDPVEWLRQRAVSALCSTASGVAEEALRLTAEYVRVREQFNKLLATFQAVSQRTGDAYINVRAIRLTALQAAWRLSAGLPASAEVAVAKYWASAGGQEVLSAATHLHGGIGVDRDYPLHRYFLTARSIDLTLGGATEHLRRIGKIIASD
jgi:alkylation response protein AidB-like acyl-CoA dehydrogenase